LLRFLAAGALNSLFGLAIYSLAILCGAPLWGALLASNLTGLGFNFVTTGGYAFRSLLLSRFPRFAAAYTSLYLVNLLLLAALTRLLVSALLAQAVLVVPMALLSFWLLSTHVFPAAEATDQR
jgi:putative flippase GtrA